MSSDAVLHPDPPNGEGGDEVCWASRVCPACGRLNAMAGPPCEACGAEDW